jgi:hypothetical protein
MIAVTSCKDETPKSAYADKAGQKQENNLINSKIGEDFFYFSLGEKT